MQASQERHQRACVLGVDLTKTSWVNTHDCTENCIYVSKCIVDEFAIYTLEVIYSRGCIATFPRSSGLAVVSAATLGEWG